MADHGDAWRTVIPTSQAGMERLPRAEREKLERRVLIEWERSAASWSGIGKHTPAYEYADAKKVHQRFKVTGEPLGEGAYGAVHRVNYTVNSKVVTLARKHIRYRRRVDINTLRAESRVMEKLDHEHIVKLVGTYTIKKDELYLLIWPVAICNLASLLDDIDDLRTDQGDRDDIVKRLSELGLREPAAIDRKHEPPLGWTQDGCPLLYLHQTMGCITEAVKYCHSQKIRHLDLKPGNILLAPGKVYLADFGIARDVQNQDHTMTMGVHGTLAWIAPEVRHSCDLEDRWSMQAADVYALGLVLLNIATALYGASITGFKDLLDELLPEIRPTVQEEKLRQYQKGLELKALATQQYADCNANTFAPKHVIGLTSTMLSSDRNARPSAKDVDHSLMELGGIDQIYHSPCCRKQSRVVTTAMDVRIAKASAEKDHLKLENERMAKRLIELEGRDLTLQTRLDNETKKHVQRYDALQRQLEDERNERLRLEAMLAEMQQGPRRQRQGFGHSRQERSNAGGQGNTAARRPPHVRNQSSSGNVIPTGPRAQVDPTTPYQPRTTVRPLSPTVVRRPEQTAAPPPPQPPKSAPLPFVATAVSPHSPGHDGPALRSRGSGSRLPIAINPSTPLRSRSGTPGLPGSAGELGSANNTMLSTTSSRASKDSGVVISSPPDTGGRGAKERDRPAMVPVDSGIGLALAERMDVSTPLKGGDSGYRGKDGVMDRDRAGSVVSTSSAAAVLTATASSPMMTASSALSSPRMGRAELVMEVSGAGAGGGAMAGAMRVPPLPTALSWADVVSRNGKK